MEIVLSENSISFANLKNTDETTINKKKSSFSLSIDDEIIFSISKKCQSDKSLRLNKKVKSHSRNKKKFRKNFDTDTMVDTKNSIDFESDFDSEHSEDSDESFNELLDSKEIYEMVKDYKGKAYSSQEIMDFYNIHYILKSTKLNLNLFLKKPKLKNRYRTQNTYFDC